MLLANPRRMAKAASKTVAALYVESDGPYANLEGVEVWDEARDARNYCGPHPVVAHPPCARWSVVAACRGTRNGQDGGCFEAALRAVRSFGGVLEHPAYSMAWRWFGLCAPPKSGGWVNADWEGGWTCCVDQQHYGHRARKGTWLYAVGIKPHSLAWGMGGYGEFQIGSGYERTGLPTMPIRERRITPEPFRDLLLSMARSVRE